MLRYTNYDIVFQEIPHEVTLAINLSNCPNRCPGCHSSYLMHDLGEVLDEKKLEQLLHVYGSAITCICFMGGDAAPHEVERLCSFVQNRKGAGLKTAWYSGKKELPQGCSLHNFNYIKLGPYIEQLGGLDHPTTNQRLYRLEDGKMIDITAHFHTKKKVAV